MSDQVVVEQALRLPARYSFGNRSGCPTNDIPPVTTSIRLFLFPKLDLLAEELRVAGVFGQERNYGG